MAPPGTEVRDRADQQRFELLLDGEVVGFARYVRRPGRVIFVHTEVDAAHGGKGLGSVLVAGALDLVRAEGVRVVPLCPYVGAFLARHPEYADLVDRELVARLDEGLSS